VSTVTVHLFNVPPRRAPAALLRMATDRRPLRQTPGLHFFKLVGTGKGDTFTPRDADPCRWGIIAAWSDASAAAAFERSTTLRAWQDLATEQLRLDLLPVRAHGTWAGRTPFTASPATPNVSHAGPVAALTRARIRWRQSRQFWSAVPPVSAALQDQPGLRLRLGFGEAPIGLQGTLSVWESAAALRTFAYRDAAHLRAIQQTTELGWYREELFARFAVTGWQGTLDGADPLAGLTGPTSRGTDVA
jgi:quinol monooxygenase YgiN